MPVHGTEYEKIREKTYGFCHYSFGSPALNRQKFSSVTVSGKALSIWRSPRCHGQCGQLHSF